MRETGGSEWVVVIRLRQLGDVLASLEVVRAIRAYRDSRRVAFVVNAPYVSLVENEPYIDRVLVPPREGTGAWLGFFREVRTLQPAAAVDLHGSARSALITRVSGAPVRVGFDVRVRRRAYTVVEPRGEFMDGRRIPHNPITWGARLARHVGCGDIGSLPPVLDAAEDARARVLGLLVGAGLEREELEQRNVIALNPGRPVASKSWQSGRFVELARNLRAAGRRVVVMWGPGEEAVASAIAHEGGAVCAPALSLVDMVAALSWCAALVTIDSGLKHLAVCARTPTVTLFGSTDPREWHMGGARDIALWRGLSCSPCRRLECPFGTPCMDMESRMVEHAVMQVAGAQS